jgi:hypothetical protein
MRKYLLATAGLMALAGTPAHAVTVVYFGSGTGVNPGDQIGAAVSFEEIGPTQVRVVLRNLSPNNADVPGNQLTGVFFNLPGNQTPGTAFTAAGSTVVGQGNCSTACNGSPQNVGGEWAYNTGLSVGGATEGLSSSGYSGVFGQPNLNGVNLQNPDALDGLQFGIMSAANNYANGNGGVENNALVQSAVTFTLNTDTNLTLAQLESVTNIRFQYGTTLTEPHFGPTSFCLDCNPDPFVTVPEPATIGLFGAGVLGLGLLRRRRQPGLTA